MSGRASRPLASLRALLVPGIALAVLLGPGAIVATGCGKYGPPVRPEPAAPTTLTPGAAASAEAAPAEAPDAPDREESRKPR